MPSQLPPKVFQNEQNIQLSYELPHRVNCAIRYPLQSPNGSTVIIYGHENGVRIIWRGGRPIKPVPIRQNGSSDAVMIIDSDDEQEEKLEFEDEESDDPIPPFVHHLDLSFGPALHLAAVSSNDLIFAVACADHVIRLISLPLTPANHTPDIASLTGHSSPPEGVAITLKGKNVFVASHSRDVTGLVLLHRVTIGNKGSKTVLSKDGSLPLQTQYLPSPALSMSFNSSHLLVVDKSACRVYSPEQETWLLTLHPGFSKLDHPNFGRKVIVDARWVQGTAIMVLLADGEWGIWDVEGCGPGVSKSLLGGQTIKGGAATLFNVSGWVEGSQVKPRSAPTSKFAPMTPSTRKTTEPSLFSGRYSNASAGQISVCSLPRSSTASFADECVALWLEDSYAVIPSLRSFWEAQIRGQGSGNLFGGMSGSRMIKLHGVTLRGERCTSIDQCPVASTSKTSIPTELLIAGEHRILIVGEKSAEKGRRRHVAADMQVVSSHEMDVRG